jgi:glycosyltransferase involved in cell wall biosynthesis
MQEHRKTIRVAIDARYIREKPSGIGVYVQALVDRIPGYAPADQFLLWAHRLARRPLSRASNTAEVTVRPGPNSPWPVLWPNNYARFTDIDVFHSPHNLMPRGLRCATVITIHDVMAIDQPNLHLQGIERAVKSFYYGPAIWRALHHATRLIVPSKATAERICNLAPNAAKRVTIIWEGADKRFRPAENLDLVQKRASALTGGDSPYLLVIGANTPTKRHDLALAAFARAVPAPWRLVLLQRRRASVQLARLAHRLHVADRTVWLGALNRDDVVSLIQAAAGLIQPSLYEGFGLPVLEAMASNCPVVASDIPALREITGGAALLVPPGDVDKLASALRDFVQSPQVRRSLGEQGVARAREFSWDRCARETLEVYHDAAASR